MIATVTTIARVDTRGREKIQRFVFQALQRELKRKALFLGGEKPEQADDAAAAAAPAQPAPNRPAAT